jgi:2-polyprenyl-3-methyl-5-hydroxy-6-metoxy-1,4-benzoquinol methylase
VHSRGRKVQLIHGELVAIDQLSVEELTRLQCQQEPLFAAAIAASPKDSRARTEITRQAYETICAILDEKGSRCGSVGDFSMGMDRRYSDLVLRLLRSQQSKGVTGGLFELGCSTGSLLRQAGEEGFRVGGLEVVPALHEAALANVSVADRPHIYLGDFRKMNLDDQQSAYSVAYWNDVFEHIPVDEISDYLSKLYSLLSPGGLLVTITPNWHMRPSDVTSTFLPPRCEACGFHLKEYTLREVVQLLHTAGFSTVQTPSFIDRNRIHVNRSLSLTWLKRWLEPSLEWMPYKVAVQACRRFGLSCTIARKPQ